jgi:hypothetical protein
MNRDEYRKTLVDIVDGEHDHKGEVMWTNEVIEPTARIVDHTARFAAAMLLCSIGTWPCIGAAFALTAVYAWRITSEVNY